jgi:hypothetical protein
VINRRAFAVFVAAHGLAHLAGTSDVFSRTADGRSVSYLAGHWTLSNPTTLRALGVLWAVMTLAFLVTAAFIWAGRPAWPRLLWWVSLASLLVVLIALWASVVGVVIDIALLAIAWHARGLSRQPTQA